MMGFLFSKMMTQLQEIYSVFKEHQSISTDSRTINKVTFFLRSKDLILMPTSWLYRLSKMELHSLLSTIIHYLNQAKSSKYPMFSKRFNNLEPFTGRNERAKVLAITGSNGKTTTKELIAKVLAKKYKIIYTEGNLNNHIGVPLTLLRIKPDTEIAVIEMGANHMGEIRKLCLLARPDYGIITNIGKAHLEGFGSLTGVINAKSEMYSYIDDNEGMLFVNQDNELLNRLSANINRFTFGSELSSNLYCELINADPFLHIAWEYKGMQSVTATKIIGTYNAENLFCAIAVGCYFRCFAG
jgi:UDP-N-acetylmuramoyl-tripeptide--D-alanyl-D-alanine ligase